MHLTNTISQYIGWYHSDGGLYYKLENAVADPDWAWYFRPLNAVAHPTADKSFSEIKSILDEGGLVLALWKGFVLMPSNITDDAVEFSLTSRDRQVSITVESTGISCLTEDILILPKAAPASVISYDDRYVQFGTGTVQDVIDMLAYLLGMV